MSRQRTIEQARATAAWNNIQEVKGQDFEAKYSSWAKKFPALVLNNGLGQALAFLRAKNKDEHQALYSHFSRWVTSQIYRTSDNELLERLIGSHSNSLDYRHATTETLAFAGWLKRFAEAELKSEEDQSQ
ncbi:MAG: type III-B CRISPR module-associated protein Cmr5 [Acidobacteria bacterium]|nr:type III-B CRISPR module-associated protein Cmr5 [Acidobacteriota bacterium]